MFSRLFGKRDKSADSPSKEAQSTRARGGSDSVPSKSGFANTSFPSTPVAAPTRAPVQAAVAAPRVPVARVAPPAPVLPASGFPSDHQIDFVLPSAPLPLESELTLEQRKNIALATVEQHHQRIANTIRTLWGYKECSVYINRLIMAGGDGMGHARVGFNQDAVDAMLALSDVHDAEFGAPSTLSGGLGLSL